MIAIIGDVHDLQTPFRAVVGGLPRAVRCVIQVGDLWVWPAHGWSEDSDRRQEELRRQLDRDLHWTRCPRDILCIEGNHHNFPLTRGIEMHRDVAPGLRFMPRGTVQALPSRSGLIRVGFLGGSDSILDLAWRSRGRDWWPDEEQVTVSDVDRLIANARTVGGIDLLVTHTPPASITMRMTRTDTAHPSAHLVEEAWRALGGGLADPALEIVSGHMHETFVDERLRVEVLPMLGTTFR